MDRLGIFYSPVYSIIPDGIMHTVTLEFEVS